MKVITIILTLLIINTSCRSSNYSKVSIEYNCLLSPCPLLKVENDSIYWIDQFSNSIVYKDKFDSKTLSKSIHKLRLDTLAESYVNNFVDDGIQLNITLIDKNKEKKVYVSNYYISGVDSLVSCLNEKLNDSLKLSYRSDLMITSIEDGMSDFLIERKKGKKQKRKRSNKKSKERKFVYYNERINEDFTVSFSYPEELKISRIENGIFIHDKSITEESEVLIRSKWIISFYNEQGESIENLISAERSFLKEAFREERSPFAIDSMNGIKVNYITKDDQMVKQYIYLNRYGTIIEIVNNGNVSKDFQIFSHSFKIKK